MRCAAADFGEREEVEKKERERGGERRSEK